MQAPISNQLGAAHQLCLGQAHCMLGFETCVTQGRCITRACCRGRCSMSSQQKAALTRQKLPPASPTTWPTCARLCQSSQASPAWGCPRTPHIAPRPDSGPVLPKVRPPRADGSCRVRVIGTSGSAAAACATHSLYRALAAGVEATAQDEQVSGPAVLCSALQGLDASGASFMVEPSSQKPLRACWQLGAKFESASGTGS